MYPVIGRGWPETLSIRFISPPSIRLNGNAHIPLLRLFLFSFSLQTFDVDKNKKPSNSGEGKKKKEKTSFEAALNKNVRFQFSPRPAAHSSRRKLRFQPHQAFFFFPLFSFFFFLSMNDAWKRSKQTNVLFRFRNQRHTHRVPEMIFHAL